MNGTSEFLVRNGLMLLFAAVFLEQMGLPLPAMPWLLAAAALVAAGKSNLGLGLIISSRVVVNRHGTEMDFESQSGETRFKVRLPLARPGAPR